MNQPNVVIVDYGMGNLFSIKNAFRVSGLETVITSSGQDILAADGVVLPGVGAFGKAMTTLRELGLVEVLQKVAQRDKPLLGICLGMQLLMSESSEFGQHEGLGIFSGTVTRLDDGQARSFKVPHIGWNSIYPVSVQNDWNGSSLEGLNQGDFMYFVHSYCVKPADPRIILSQTRYEGVEFCSSLERKNIFACQFHPEKSADKGLHIYQNWIKRNWGKLSADLRNKEPNNVV